MRASDPPVLRTQGILFLQELRHRWAEWFGTEQLLKKIMVGRQLQKFALDREEGHFSTAQLAAKLFHFGGIRSVRAPFNWPAGVGVDATVITQPAAKCLVTPFITMTAVRLRGCYRINGADITSGIINLRHGLQKISVVPRLHPVINMNTDQRQRFAQFLCIFFGECLVIPIQLHTTS